MSPHSRMGHKFHIGQRVEFHPKKGAPISAAREPTRSVPVAGKQLGRLKERQPDDI